MKKKNKMKKKNNMRKPIIKKGDKYNRLTAIKFAYMDKKSQQYWLFKCACGKEKIMRVVDVKSSRARSCGCLNREKIMIHGMIHTREYKTWQTMKARCLNKNSSQYKNYGSRNIRICNRWLNSFKKFYKDMGKRPIAASLDRIDNNLGYNKDNCRWATAKEQNNNKRNNHLLIFNGKTKNITQWAEKIGINRNILYGRLNRGWSVERTLRTI